MLLVIAILSIVAIIFSTILIYSAYSQKSKLTSKDTPVKVAWNFPALEKICYNLINNLEKWVLTSPKDTSYVLLTYGKQNECTTIIRVYRWYNNDSVGYCSLYSNLTKIRLSANDERNLREAVITLKKTLIKKEQDQAKAAIEKELYK